MERSGTVRLLCVGMIAAVIVLSLLMVVAVCGGIPVLGEGDETVRKGLGFYDLLGEDPTGPPPFVDTVDWENMTMPPETTEGDGTLPVEPGMDDKAELDADMMNTPILEVEPEVDGDIYLKMQSYGDYTGQGWTEAQAYSKLLDGVSADFLLGSMFAELSGAPAPSLGILPLMEFSVLPYYAYQIEGDIPVSDVKVEGNTEGAFRVWYFPVDNIPDSFQTPEAYRDYERALRTYAYGAYLNVDGETKEYMQRIIDEQGFSADDPDIIEKVAEYIRGAAVYNLKFDEAMEEESNVVISFLEDYKEGVCRHYAAAATLLFRSLYIPARYTVGFHAEGTAGETTVVKGSDAHAWVEVYVDGFGWQKVEVTGSPETEKPLVELSLPDVYLPYNNGVPLAYPTDRVMGFEEYETMGYRCEVAVEPAVLIRGQAEAVSIKAVEIFDPDGNPVTAQFDISLSEDHEAVFTIYHEAIEFRSYGNSKVYDGTALTMQTDDIYIFPGKADLPDGYTFEVVPEKMGSITRVGKSAATFAVKILYEGKDVTADFTRKCYFGEVDEKGEPIAYVALSKGYGVLEIKPRPITLTAGSATVSKSELSGGELTAHWIVEINHPDAENYPPVPDLLARGDYIDVDVLRFNGSKSVRGKADNEIVLDSIIIRNAVGEDVTKNYVITTVKGLLRVK